LAELLGETGASSRRSGNAILFNLPSHFISFLLAIGSKRHQESYIGSKKNRKNKTNKNEKTKKRSLDQGDLFQELAP